MCDFSHVYAEAKNQICSQPGDGQLWALSRCVSTDYRVCGAAKVVLLRGGCYACGDTRENCWTFRKEPQ